MTPHEVIHRQALAGICGNAEHNSPHATDFATTAYQYADAMLAEREKAR
jgi:hypothetical protein